MTDHGTSVRATLDAWRGQQADRLDPLRFHFIEALERRAAGHDGEVRRILDERLAGLIASYARDLKKAARGRCKAPMAVPDTPARGALAALAELIAGNAAARGSNPATDGMPSRSAIFPELEALGEFRDIWSAARTRSQMRQSLEQVPSNAGPLNSGALVHRAITLMRELSPGYLQHFLSYIDVLSCMEQMNGGGPLPAKNAPHAASTRKRTRAKPRSPRE